MLPTQTLGVSGIVDTGFSLYRATLRRVWLLALIAALPYALASSWFTLIANSINLEIDLSVGADLQSLIETLRETTMLALKAVAPLVPVMLLGANFMLAAVGHRIVALARGEVSSYRDDLYTGLKLTIPLTVALSLYLVVTTLGSFLFVVPGVILSVSMCLFFCVPLLEGRSAWSSLWRSHVLVWKGGWWRTASVLSIVTLISIAVLIVFAILGSVFGGGVGSGAVFAGLASGAVSGLMMALLVPLSTCIFLVLYNDLLLRLEV